MWFLEKPKYEMQQTYSFGSLHVLIYVRAYICIKENLISDSLSNWTIYNKSDKSLVD